MMENISDPKIFESILKKDSIVLAYFSGEKCNVCHSLKPKIEQLMHDRFPTIKHVEIKTELAPQLIAQYSIFSAPVVLLFIEEKEYIREGRNLSILELTRKMEKIIHIYQD